MFQRYLFLLVLCSTSISQLTPPITFGPLVGSSGSQGSNDGTGTLAKFATPAGLLWDNGLLYLADWVNCNIRVVDVSSRAVSTLAGSTSCGFLNGVGTSAQFNNPNGLILDNLGTLYIADAANNVIRTLALSTKSVTTFAGSGSKGSNDGTGAVASFDRPYGLVLDNALGVLYVLDTYNSKVRKIVISSVAVSTIAGGASTGDRDGTGTNALFNLPTHGVLNGGDLYITSGIKIRILNIATNVVSTLTFASTLNLPNGLALDPSGSILYVCDSGNGRVKSVSLATQSVVTYNISLNAYGITIDSAGKVFVAVWQSSTVIFFTTTNLPPSQSSTTTLTATATPTSTKTASFSATLTCTKTGSPTPSFTPTPTATATVSQTSTPTSSITASNTATLTNTRTETPTPTSSRTPTPSTTVTATQTISPTSSVTASPTSSVTPSNTATLTNTGTGSATATSSITASNTATSTITGTGSPTPTFSSTPSPTSTASQTSTLSSTATGSQSSSPSLSSTSSITPTKSPTPTSSPPPFSCLTRDDGCKSPTLVFSAPVFSSGVSLPANSIPFVSYPFIFQPFNISLPVPPSSGESVSITCSFLNAYANEVYIVELGGTSRMASWGASFQAFASPSTKGTPQSSSTFTLSCDVASTLRPGGGALPHYGAHTLLTSPVLLIPSLRFPPLAAILAESVGKSGKFRGLGGVLGGPWTLDGRNTTNTSWASPTLFTTVPSASDTLASFRSLILSQSLDASQPPPLFVSTISGKTHLLLFSSLGTSFPFGSSVNVSLGGYQCTTNWVTPDSTVVSVTTPSGMGDFGIAPLSLWGDGGEDFFFRLLQNYSTSATGLSSSILPPLSYPAVFPPLLPLGGMPPPSEGGYNTTIITLSPLIGLSPPTLLASTAATSTFPINTLGIRVVTACSDPTFAPPEDCVVVNNTAQPYLNTTIFLGCAWGTGDSCQPCPVGALCPGGEVLIPTPGYWVPTLSSPITDFIACPQPAATQRCPALGGGGGALQLASGYSNCGVGYRGRACAVCDSGFYTAPDDTCARCPGISATLGILLPFAYLTLGLLGLGCVLVVVLHCVLMKRWERLTRGKCVGGDEQPPPPPTLVNSAASVGQLILWLWVAAQSSASLFSQARSIAPRALFSLYGILAALQLQGVTVDPACFTSQPFLSFWVCMGATLLGLVGLLLCAVVATSFESRVGWVSSVAQGGLLVNAICLTMTYGAIVSVFADVLTCTLPAPLGLYDYVVAVSDGSALTAALGSGAPPLSALRAAASNPYLAGNSQLYAFMQATRIPVSVQASNTFQVCKEGPHYAAWWAAFSMTLGFTFGFPALGWVTLYYSTAAAGRREGGKERHLFSLRALSHLSFHLSDSTFRPQAQWLLYAGQGGLAMITGLVGLSKRYGAADIPYFTAGQGGIVVVSALLALVTHRTRPFAPLHTWKHPISLALFGLTGITSAFNAIIVNLPKGSGSIPSDGATRTVLGSIPLVCALVLGVVVVSSWLRSVIGEGVGLVVVVEPPMEVSATAASDKAVDEDGGGALAMFDNPLASPPPPPSPSTQPPPVIWRAVRYPDGDLAWKSSSSSLSPQTVVWTLPPGAATACGWQHDIPSDTWVHGGSGVTSSRPPPRVFHGLVEGGSGYWHCYETQESLYTLPGAPCETACGWVAMGRKKGGGSGEWRHIPTGQVRLTPPPPPQALPTVPGGPQYDFEPPGPLWRRHVDESDGDCFWHCEVTGVSTYDLPVGSHTVCGWRALRDGGGWVHISGAKSTTPPSLNEKQAEVHILTHLQGHVKDAWAQPFG